MLALGEAGRPSPFRVFVTGFVLYFVLFLCFDFFGFYFCYIRWVLGCLFWMFVGMVICALCFLLMLWFVLCVEFILDVMMFPPFLGSRDGVCGMGWGLLCLSVV